MSMTKVDRMTTTMNTVLNVVDKSAAPLPGAAGGANFGHLMDQQVRLAPKKSGTDTTDTRSASARDSAENNGNAKSPGKTAPTRDAANAAAVASKNIVKRGKEKNEEGARDTTSDDATTQTDDSEQTDTTNAASAAGAAAANPTPAKDVAASASSGAAAADDDVPEGDAQLALQDALRQAVLALTPDDVATTSDDQSTSAQDASGVAPVVTQNPLAAGLAAVAVVTPEQQVAAQAVTANDQTAAQPTQSTRATTQKNSADAAVATADADFDHENAAAPPRPDNVIDVKSKSVLAASSKNTAVDDSPTAAPLRDDQSPADLAQQQIARVVTATVQAQQPQLAAPPENARVVRRLDVDATRDVSATLRAGNAGEKLGDISLMALQRRAAVTTAAADTAPLVRSIHAQFREALQASVQERRNTVEMRLDPPEWGTLHVRLQIQRNEVQLTVVAEHQFVKEALDRGLAQLRQSLTDQGLQLGHLQVSVGQQSAQQHGRDDESTWSSSGPAADETAVEVAGAARPAAVRAAGVDALV